MDIAPAPAQGRLLQDSQEEMLARQERCPALSRVGCAGTEPDPELMPLCSHPSPGTGEERFYGTVQGNSSAEGRALVWGMEFPALPEDSWDAGLTTLASQLTDARGRREGCMQGTRFSCLDDAACASHRWPCSPPRRCRRCCAQRRRCRATSEVPHSMLLPGTRKGRQGPDGGRRTGPPVGRDGDRRNGWCGCWLRKTRTRWEPRVGNDRVDSGLGQRIRRDRPDGAVLKPQVSALTGKDGEATNSRMEEQQRDRQVMHR